MSKTHLIVSSRDLEKIAKALAKATEALAASTALVATLQGNDVPAVAKKPRAKKPKKETAVAAAPAQEAAAPVKTPDQEQADKARVAFAKQQETAKKIAAPVKPNGALQLPRVPGMGA